MDDTTRGVNRGDLDPESDRRTRQIQGEIAETRAEMSETIDALQERLRPGNLVSDARDKVKAATAEKVKSMADRASGTAQGMARETRDRAYDLVEGARQNPIPALMIGAGVAWLLMDRSRRHGDGHVEHAEWSEYNRPRYRTYQEADSDDVGTYGSMRTAAARSEGLGTWARQTASEAGHTARRTGGELQRMMRQNPLLVGAAAMLAGAAIGASLPETERENEWMGEARDNVVERAQEAARDTAGAVREATGEAVGDVVSKVTERVTSKGT